MKLKIITFTLALFAPILAFSANSIQIPTAELLDTVSERADYLTAILLALYIARLCYFSEIINWKSCRSFCISSISNEDAEKDSFLLHSTNERH